MAEPELPPAPPADRSTELPPRDGDAPLHELSRDELSVFFYTSFLPEELTELVRKLGLSLPGYRLESLPDVQKADLLADELRARPEARAAVLAKMREVFEFPALDGVVLPPSVAGEVAHLAVDDDATTRMLWRVLADPAKEIRAAGGEALRRLVALYYGPPAKGGAVADAGAPPAAAAPGKGGAKPDAALVKEAQRARQVASRSKEKIEDIKAQLKASRAELAAAQKEAATYRRSSEKLTEQLARAEERARDLKARPARAELDHARKEVGDLSARADALEGRAKRLAEERDALAQELDAARRALEQERGARPAAPAPTPEEDAAEVPATWLLPRFTREFYDSLERWDPRIQRTAIKQAFLLAENHRHPSLRAIPLEGLPGYYRVRIATDVRLIYRRAEKNEREVEILSLIDREDLDRYVRQAKTR